MLKFKTGFVLLLYFVQIKLLIKIGIILSKTNLSLLLWPKTRIHSLVLFFAWIGQGLNLDLIGPLFWTVYLRGLFTDQSFGCNNRGIRPALRLVFGSSRFCQIRLANWVFLHLKSVSEIGVIVKHLNIITLNYL